jgi:hypothetical protein
MSCCRMHAEVRPPLATHFTCTGIMADLLMESNWPFGCQSDKRPQRGSTQWTTAVFFARGRASPSQSPCGPPVGPLFVTPARWRRRGQVCYHTPAFPGRRSSAGQSSGIIIRVSQVRVLPPLPALLLDSPCISGVFVRATCGSARARTGPLAGLARVVVLHVSSEEIDDGQSVSGVERGAARRVH